MSSSTAAARSAAAVKAAATRAANKAAAAAAATGNPVTPSDMDVLMAEAETEAVSALAILPALSGSQWRDSLNLAAHHSGYQVTVNLETGKDTWQGVAGQISVTTDSRGTISTVTLSGEDGVVTPFLAGRAQKWEQLAEFLASGIAPTDLPCLPARVTRLGASAVRALKAGTLTADML